MKALTFEDNSQGLKVDKLVSTKIIRLFTLNVYEAIVNLGLALINYHLIEILSLESNC